MSKVEIHEPRIYEASEYRQSSGEFSQLEDQLSRRCALWGRKMLGDGSRPSPVRERKRLEDAVSFIAGEEPSIIDASRRAYLVIVNPSDGRYETLALLGPWSESDRDIWFHEWLPVGSRKIESGHLFRRVRELRPGQAMGIWWQTSDLVSDVPKKLKFTFAVIVPVFFESHIVAILVYDSAEEAKEEEVAWLYRVCAHGFLPLLLPSAQGLTEVPLVSMICRILEQTGRELEYTTRREVRHLLEVKDAIAGNTVSNEHGNKLLAAGGALVRQSRSLPALVSSLRPTKEDVTGKIVSDSIETLVLEEAKLLEESPNAGLADIPPYSWQFDILPAISIQISELALRRVVKELLLNSLSAITEQLIFLAERENCELSEALDFFRKEFGYPEVGIELASKPSEDGLFILSFRDNGIGIQEYIRPRIFQLGFSTRQSGTGLGLNIIRANVEAAGGAIEFAGSADGETRICLELKGEDDAKGKRSYS